ncbi:cytochrome b5 domain-containing protein [uncultured Clostridium sp.]|uniref:cytochrome b5 domain-containing protein n=1 Tax=uncultured Clostridium sp. TaxID=59620 RepID=UPI0026297DCB|nr:cytochrome b5 domain-containing protein [uncultured Clostridium sp.]
MLLDNLILRKNNEINYLKSALYNRDSDKEYIIEKLKYVVEELEEIVNAQIQFMERLKKFTTQEVAKYDGTGDNLAYVIINGTVYDVTGIPEFTDKKCNFKIGADITKEFNSCNFINKNILKKARTVGILYE